jgi:hypothetical protein
MSTNDEVNPTSRTRLRRKQDRGRYDTDTVYEILDEAIVDTLVLQLGALVGGAASVLVHRGSELLVAPTASPSCKGSRALAECSRPIMWSSPRVLRCSQPP